MNRICQDFLGGEGCYYCPEIVNAADAIWPVNNIERLGNLNIRSVLEPHEDHVRLDSSARQRPLDRL